MGKSWPHTDMNLAKGGLVRSSEHSLGTSACVVRLAGGGGGGVGGRDTWGSLSRELTGSDIEKMN